MAAQTDISWKASSRSSQRHVCTCPCFYRTIILQTTHLPHTGRACHRGHLSTANFTLLEFWLLYCLMIKRDQLGLYRISMLRLISFPHSKRISSLKKKKKKKEGESKFQCFYSNISPNILSGCSSKEQLFSKGNIS